MSLPTQSNHSLSTHPLGTGYIFVMMLKFRNGFQVYFAKFIQSDTDCITLSKQCGSEEPNVIHFQQKYLYPGVKGS